jgi:predicted O-methyltransferase YrrM
VDEDEQLINVLYSGMLNRSPSEKELQHWVGALRSGVSPAAVATAFVKSPEHQAKHEIFSVFSPGHYHSPVVDPRTVRSYWEQESRHEPADISAINVDPAPMLAIWNRNLDFIKETPFTDERSHANRYYYTGGPFPWGDGISLRMMMNELLPQRIVEIGSGFSTACMLDSADQIGIRDLQITCVEPYPDRLLSIMRPEDHERVTLLERFVQDIPEDVVDELEAGDILFIDSTHVLKTGSDVHFEFFHLIPRLRPGVVIHFHDVQFPFEYPAQWVFEENYSWNEAYAVRLFLMFNDEFEVIFWGSLLALSYADRIRGDFPIFLRNPGSSIWLRRRPG